MAEEKLTWTFPDGCNVKHIDFKDKDNMTSLLTKIMLQKTNIMFKWKNLPETIPEHYLEQLIQINGYAGIIKKDDKLYAVRGGIGGVRNYNYEPTLFIVSNPYLLLTSKQYNVYYGKEAETENPISNNPKTDGDCVLIYNDNMYMGLLPLSNFYASQLTENIISKRLLTINSRAMYVFIAGDDDVKKDFDDFMKDLENGEVGSVLAEGIMGEGAKTIANTLPLTDKNSRTLTDLIEDQQYIKASWLNDLGLQANYNMKRESINSNEAQLNKDAILPLVDNMYNMRKLACKRINELFGTNWDVEYNSAWNYTRIGIEQALDALDDSSELELGKEKETIQVDKSENEEKEPNQVDNSEVENE